MFEPQNEIGYALIYYRYSKKCDIFTIQTDRQQLQASDNERRFRDSYVANPLGLPRATINLSMPGSWDQFQSLLIVQLNVAN